MGEETEGCTSMYCMCMDVYSIYVYIHVYMYLTIIYISYYHHKLVHTLTSFCTERRVDTYTFLTIAITSFSH